MFIWVIIWLLGNFGGDYMNINNILKAYNDCYLLVSDNNIIQAGSDFYALTGYDKKNIAGKSFREICELLKLDINIDNSDINIDNKYFLHTNNNEVIEIRILQEKTVYENMKIYYFIKAEETAMSKNYTGRLKPIDIVSSEDENFEIYCRLHLPIFKISYPDFKILDLNKDALNYIKCSKEQSMQIQELFPGFFSESNINLINEMEKTNNPVYSRNNRLIYDNKEMYFNYIYHPLKSANNEFTKFMVILEDITQEVLEKVRIENAAKSQEEFFSFITHEFRTPLTAICSTLQLLELVYTNEMTENIKKYLRNIKRNTYQQLRLVNYLLDITKAESGFLVLHKKNQDIVSLTKAISDSVRSFAESRHINVRFLTNLKQKYTAVDDEKYERIILNLLSNAIKFTSSEKNIYVTVSSNDKRIIICVRDEGAGIPKDKQKIIFNKFRQAGNKLIKYSEGSGIGLYLVKLLVEKMNGTINVISDVNKGSSFVITLPEEIIENDEIEISRDLTDSHIVQSMQMEFSVIYDG